MDETVEKKIIEESADFSIFSLFLQADVVVKIVILLLLIASASDFVGNVSQPELDKSLLTSLADGIFEELTK